jgi:hypothetical protein
MPTLSHFANVAPPAFAVFKVKAGEVAEAKLARTDDSHCVHFSELKIA